MTSSPIASSTIAADLTGNGVKGTGITDMKEGELTKSSDYQAILATTSAFMDGLFSSFLEHPHRPVEIFGPVSRRSLNSSPGAGHETWDASWCPDDDEDDVGEGDVEEKTEVRVGSNRTGLERMPTGRASLPLESLPLPYLSVGPYIPSGDFSGESPVRHPFQDTVVTPSTSHPPNSNGVAERTATPKAVAMAAGSAPGTPGQRGLHHRKPSIPRLGMLQNAQDIVSSAAIAPAASPRRRATESDLPSARRSDVRQKGSHPADHLDSSTTGAFWEAGWDETSDARWAKGGTPAGAAGGEGRSLRARAHSLKRVLGNLPGPKQILQGETEMV